MRSEEIIIGIIIYGWVAAIMIVIGIMQKKSIKPVGFYTGEKPPKEQELIDITAWNRKHGNMWIIYGFIILISYGISYGIGESIWSVVPMCGGVIFPLPIMMWYHHRLLKKYLNT